MGVAIITGAARGIGAAIADELHAAGHELVLIDRCSDDPRLDYSLGTEAELRAVAERCSAQIIVGDVADLSTAEAAVELARDSFGGVDIAIASAGVMAGTVKAWEISDDAWNAMFATNMTGTLQLARAAVPEMLKRDSPRQGRFVALSTAIALKATPELAGYAASKAAVLSFVRSMAADLGGTGITANVVQPGSTKTALLDRSAAIYGLDSPSDFAEHHLNERLLEPAEIAAAVGWLCSAAASAVTGTVLPVDGGMTAR